MITKKLIYDIELKNQIHDIENQLDYILTKNQEFLNYKDIFIKEFKFLLLNGFYMYSINYDFLPVFIYSDQTFNFIYIDLSLLSIHKIKNYYLNDYFLNSKYTSYYNDINIDLNINKIILKIPIINIINKKIHYFYNNNKLNMYFTLFLKEYHISLYHPFYNLYDILYDGIELLNR